jgi:hypothetical protein
VRNQILVKEKRSVAGGHPAVLTFAADLTTCQNQPHLKPMSCTSDVKSLGEAMAIFFLAPTTTGIARLRPTENAGVRPVVLSFGNLKLSRNLSPVQWCWLTTTPARLANRYLMSSLCRSSQKTLMH